MLIVIIGPDGSGKTTLALRVIEHLKSQGRSTVFFEQNFGLLPRFRDILSFVLRRKIGKVHAPGEYLAGMEEPPNSTVKALVYLFWYGLDFIIGGIVYRRQIQNDYVIFARYAYDYGFLRSYSRVPLSVVKFMLFVVPTPNLVFTIDRSSQDIFGLKPELSIEEISRQQKKINSMLKRKKYFHVLDGSDGVEETTKRAIDLITMWHSK